MRTPKNLKIAITRTFRSVLLIIIILFGSGCVRDLAELNVNPDQPLTTNPNSLFRYVLQQGAGNYNSDVNLEQWGLMNWTMYMATRGGVEPGREYDIPSGKDVYWREQYTNTLSNAQEIVNMADQDPQLSNMKAAAQILQVYIFQIITDLWGAIPYSKALQGISDLNLSPAYDSQRDAYLGMIQKLHTAINAFDDTKPFFEPSADLIYRADMNKWIAFGNSLLLRLATRINKVEPGIYSDIVNQLSNQPMISHNSESAIFPFNSVVKNHLWETMSRNESTNQNNPSKFFVDLTTSRNDPRVKIYFEKAPLSFLPFIPNYKGVPNLLPNNNEAWSNYNLNATIGVSGEWGDICQIGSWFLHNNTPGVFMSYSEVCFLQAEAALNGLWSTSADELLARGVRANMEFYNRHATDQQVITELEISSYIQNLPSADLEEIITQKWLSFAYEQGYEAYAEYRRTGFPVLKDFVGNPIDRSVFPLRMPYPNSEVTLNRNNYNDALLLQGADIAITKLWWMGEN
ncbi:MAG: SusD/RagB family nutrient-binding outer membrane lipoprotein [Salinivirgaceae bacterium]|nr:SusD/RagB family nutrient-binding outer membrane lipoprotein [Salinivirgaceae bacterium]MDD4747681.1 SusD/RagB family nutrient-binding outer membrane lipoprotein [Salinivirgaceae bacterium]MDY0281759.1 SusD/RagB family nutrient-binding outer membrane lipoprotein [Salinivirgaceae bacterium]